MNRTKQVRIAVSGSHGTGKTTLCRALNTRLSASYACEIRREAPQLMMDEASNPLFFYRDQNSLTKQLLVFVFQAMEDHPSDEADIIIHDRSPVDILAYTLLLAPDYEHTEEGRLLHSAVHRWLKRYDLIFRTPIAFPIPDDGSRDQSLAFQRSVQDKIDSLYAAFHFTPITISGSTERRVTNVKAHIENLLRKYQLKIEQDA